MIFKVTISALIGGSLGYLYYKKIGCSSGTCPITSNPYASILYGTLIGIMVGS